MPSTEKELISNLIQGDVRSFEEVFKNYNRKIFIFSYKYLKNQEDSEGIVQEVFMKLWENSKNLKSDSNLNAWLFTVTFNAIRKRFRKLTTEKKHLDYYSTLHENQKEEISDSDYFDLLEKTSSLIQELPPQQRKVILLRKEKGLSSEEMAKELNLSKKTVENHLNRARAFLRKGMKEDGLILVLLHWLIIG